MLQLFSDLFRNSFNTRTKITAGAVFLFLLLITPLLILQVQQQQTLEQHAAGIASPLPCQFLSQQPGDPPLSVAFCDPLSTPNPIGNRSGQLDGVVWGVSRWTGNENLGEPNIADWAIDESHNNANTNGVAGVADPVTSLCGNSTNLQPDGDLAFCNGMLNEITNDAGTVTSLAMYPKQPFNFAGRTGTVVFDVSNNTQGSHASWPEFWMSDLPVPAPFVHGSPDGLPAFGGPANGFGIRLSAACIPEEGGNCGTNCPSNNTGMVFTVDSVVVVRNYEDYDTTVTGTQGSMTLTTLDCVKEPTGPGSNNHIEIRVSQNQIDVYGTDAGTTSPLHHLAVITNANLTLPNDQGLIWIEDVHYNADKAPAQTGVDQRTNVFSWANVGFDGPVNPRDLAFDVSDHLVPGGFTQAESPTVPSTEMGWAVPSDGSTLTLTVGGGTNQANSMTAANIAAASKCLLTYNLYSHSAVTINYRLNNTTWHAIPWPFPDSDFGLLRSYGQPINCAELKAGPNSLDLTASDGAGVANVDVILAGAGGTVAPSGGPTPSMLTLTPAPTQTTSTPAPSPTSTPIPTPTSTQGQTIIGTAWNNVTNNLAGLATQCGNLTMVSAVPNTNKVLAGVAGATTDGGLYVTTNKGASWSQLGTGVGSEVITNRPTTITYDPTNTNIFWEAGIYGNYGIFATTDGGNTFHHVGTSDLIPSSIEHVAIDFSDPSRLTLIAGAHEQSHAIDKSTDGGTNWTNIWDVLSPQLEVIVPSNPPNYSFTPDPIVINAQTYIINGYISWSGGAPGIFRTTDGGTSWQKVSSEGPDGAALLATDGTIYWADGNSLVKSTNQGLTWSKVGSNLQDITPIQLPNGDIASADINNKLVISADGGNTWTEIGPSMPIQLPQGDSGVLTYSPQQQAFFISHWDCGSVVLPDAVAELDASFGATNTSPTPTLPPLPTATNTPPPPSPTLTGSPHILGDITGPTPGVPDGKVCYDDVSMLVNAVNWLHTPGNPPLNPQTDFSGPTPGVPDGFVNLLDLSAMAKNFSGTAVCGPSQ